MPPSASPETSEPAAALEGVGGSNYGSSLCQFYRGANIFLTGATGFLGKLLLEKLLRVYPDLGTIYILVRSKKGQEPQQRADAIFDEPLLAKLREKRPKCRQHVVAVAGDCSLPGLGLSEEDRAAIVDNVNIIFHGAATVRFDEKIRLAVAINVKGTAEVLQLAKEVKNLKVMMHVSTAFSNCNRREVNEVLYDVPMNADNVMQLVDSANDELLEVLDSHLKGTWPNSYAFTKALGENYLKNHAEDIPVGVFRPSIVIATASEPVPGWIDNLYGPTGVVLATGLGVMHCLQASNDNVADMVPGDMVINALIAAAWETGSMSSEERAACEGIPVYNYVSSTDKPITWRQFMRVSLKHGELIPLSRGMWKPTILLVKNYYVFLLLSAVLHFLPALLIDTVCIIINNPFRLLPAYKKIMKFSNVISYFATRNWDFKNDRVRSLWQKLEKNDQELFRFNIKDLNWTTYLYDYINGLRTYILKDDPKTIPEALEKLKRFNWLHQGLKLVLVLLAARVCWAMLFLAAPYVPDWAVPAVPELAAPNAETVTMSRSTLIGALRHLGIIPTS